MRTHAQPRVVRRSRLALAALCVLACVSGTVPAHAAKKQAAAEIPSPKSAAAEPAPQKVAEPAAASRADEPMPVPNLDPAEQALWQRLCFRVEDAFDSTRGGFVTKHGILDESAVDVGFLLGPRDRNERWNGYAVYTTQWMLGLEDSIGGGFFARREVVPGGGQFERPTLINARRLENLIDAWERTNDTRYWVSAVRLLEFAERNVVDGRGGFTSNPVGDQDLIPQVNGVAIRAWLKWWAAGRDPKRRDFALRSIDRLWQSAWSDSAGFLRANSFGEPLAWPQLSDQTEMGRALVMSAQLAGRRSDLDRARKVADLMLANFADDRGTFRSEAVGRPGRFRRNPGRVPRENARAALFLCELAHVARAPKYYEAARRVWRAYAKDLEKTKLEAADWVLAMDAAISPVFPRRPLETAKPADKAKSPRTNGKTRMRSPETKIGASGQR